MFNRKIVFTILAVSSLPVFAQQGPHSVELVAVESRAVSQTVSLPAELTPFLQTEVEARVPGYIERVLVDRGSEVKRGQLLVELSAPELAAETSAAESSWHEAQAAEGQAEAQAAAAQSNFDRLHEAAETPGAVAGNELVQVQKQLEAAKSIVQSRQAAVRSALYRLHVATITQSYLRVTAPFSGTVTDRYVHPGMMVPANSHMPLLKLQQTNHLRLTVPVPETFVAHIVRGTPVNFHTASQTEKTYSASISRIAAALDAQNRTMMVELDVFNRDGALAPGMYPTVDWPLSSGAPLLLVPSTSVVTTTERTFVITAPQGRAHWVTVRKGPAVAGDVAIRGDIKAGEKVVKRASDEIREGTPLL